MRYKTSLAPGTSALWYAACLRTFVAKTAKVGIAKDSEFVSLLTTAVRLGATLDLIAKKGKVDRPTLGHWSAEAKTRRIPPDLRMRRRVRTAIRQILREKARSIENECR